MAGGAADARQPQPRDEPRAVAPDEPRPSRIDWLQVSASRRLVAVGRAVVGVSDATLRTCRAALGGPPPEPVLGKSKQAAYPYGMPEQVRQRPRAAHLGPERRRPLVLDAALEEFVKHGYRGTSMETIADAAGVSKPVVYECYPSKEKLFWALLEREEKRLLEAVAEALPTNPSFEDVESVLAEGLTALLSAAAATPLSWRVVYDAEHGGDPAVLKRVLRSRAQITAQLTQLVALFLEQAGTKDVERKAPVLAELLAASGRTSVRILLDSGGKWTPEELGSFVARVQARGAAAA